MECSQRGSQVIGLQKVKQGTEMRPTYTLLETWLKERDSVLDPAQVLTCQQPSQRPLSNHPIHGGSSTLMHLFKATVNRQSDLGMPNMCAHASATVCVHTRVCVRALVRMLLVQDAILHGFYI